MKIGFTTVTFRGKNLEELVEIAARSGAAGMEWGGDVHVAPGDLNSDDTIFPGGIHTMFHYKTLDEVKEQAQKLGVRLPFAENTGALCQPRECPGVCCSGRSGWPA